MRTMVEQLHEVGEGGRSGTTSSCRWSPQNSNDLIGILRIAIGGFTSFVALMMLRVNSPQREFDQGANYDDVSADVGVRAVSRRGLSECRPHSWSFACARIRRRHARVAARRYNVARIPATVATVIPYLTHNRPWVSVYFVITNFIRATATTTLAWLPQANHLAEEGVLYEVTTNGNGSEERVREEAYACHVSVASHRMWVALAPREQGLRSVFLPTTGDRIYGNDYTDCARRPIASRDRGRDGECGVFTHPSRWIPESANAGGVREAVAGELPEALRSRARSRASESDQRHRRLVTITPYGLLHCALARGN